MNATTATPVATTGTQPAPTTIGPRVTQGATPQALTQPGAGVTESALPAIRRTDTAVTVPLDDFATRAGPDASVRTDAGLVMVHAVFAVDPATKEMSVSVVDDAGRLIRIIPPDSVAQMIAAMAAYRGR